MALTATERSKARNQRAARLMGGITLDREHNGLLDRILAATDETAAAWVRRMIREYAASLGAARPRKSKVRK